MNQARATEYRIIRRLVDGSDVVDGRARGRLAECLICGVAGAAALVLLGSHVPELLWAGLAASVVFSLGLPD